jgi:fructoselysine-6-P-deglycase FrlB-like protein
MDQVVKEALDKALLSDYFTGARIARELDDFLSRRTEECCALADLIDEETPVFLVGSGGSYANALTAEYVWDRLLAHRVKALASYDLVWRRPQALGPGAVALFNSLSGETEDTVAALREAAARGARTVALVRDADTTLGREADVVVPYDYFFCYEGPVVAMLLTALELARRAGREAAREADLIEASLTRLPGILGPAVERELAAAEEKAAGFLDCSHLYVVGAGPLSSLAYKVALTVVMENIRIGATYCDASEFRHGPAEALERVHPDVLMLLGTDESRPLALRTLEILQRGSAHVLVYDAADQDDTIHPLLTGLLLNSLTQCFVVHSALRRGIFDLDDRVLMGHGVLAADGAGWP